MILRVCILGILLVALLWIIFTQKEGFQIGAGSAAPVSCDALPPPADSATIMRNFWSIVSQQKTWSAVTPVLSSGSSSGSSGSASSMTKALLTKVMNPGPSDLFKVVFPNYISIYALSKYNMNAGAARCALVNNYDGLNTEMVKAVQTASEKQVSAAYDAGGASTGAQACADLNAFAMSLYGQLIKINAAATDLSGGAILAGALHDENKGLQAISACVAQGTGSGPSPACIKLASQDQTLFPVLQQYDAANAALFVNGASIQNTINMVIQAYNGLSCTLPPTTDPTKPSISSVFSDTYLVSLGTVDTETLSAKLEELSPYYVSPDIVNYITRKLIGGTAFNANLQSTTDYVLDMSKVTNSILTMTTNLGSGQFYNEVGGSFGQIGMGICPAGYYCTKTASIPTPCPVGSYCPAGTIEDPIPCPTTKPYSRTGASDESQCISQIPDGYYADSTTNLPTKCPAGVYCTGGTIIPCPAGQYNPNKAQTSALNCLPCPKGAYCPPSTTVLNGVTLGSQTATPCVVGTYSSNTGQTDKNTCLKCPPGTTCTKPGLSAAVPCPAGTYSSAQGHTTDCTAGPAGYYSSTVGATSSSGFTQCPIAYYCPAGSNNPIGCSPGGYCDKVGMSTPLPCAAGRYGSSTGNTSSSCDGACTAGYYCGPGSVIATQGVCPAGYYCPTGTPSPVICPIGSYCPPGSVTPSKCAPGTYSQGTGAQSLSDCGPCAAGTFCNNTTNGPQQCPLGTFCPSGSSAARICPAGSYCDSVGMSAPLPCPMGTYNGSTGSTTMTQCSNCPGGSYNPYEGQQSCVGVCPIGSYCPRARQCVAYVQPGTSTMISIPIGTIMPVLCPPGTFCDTTSMEAPNQCPPGKVSTATGATSSTTCVSNR